MKWTTLLPLFLARALATPHCKNVTVPVTIDARLAQFDLSPPRSEVDVTNFILGLTRNGFNLSQELLTGYRNSPSKTYKIAGTYCEPESGATPDTVQLLTHGLGFDRSYWDFSLNNFNYSYVRSTIRNTKTATFAWDRLGVAQSQHGDPVNEIQAPLELAALRALTDKLRQGEIPGVPCRFKKVLHVGHSFGSILSVALTSMYPSVSQGLVLTGYSFSGDFIGIFAAAANFVPARSLPALKSYAPGYIAASDTSAFHYLFFGPKDFDADVLHAAFRQGQPIAPGEYLSAPSFITSPFTGPVLLITGENDVPFCGGNCYGPGKMDSPSIIAAGKSVFPKASRFKPFVVPGAGHGLNLGYSHTITYKKIQSFINSIL